MEASAKKFFPFVLRVGLIGLNGFAGRLLDAVGAGAFLARRADIFGAGSLEDVLSLWGGLGEL